MIFLSVIDEARKKTENDVRLTQMRYVVGCYGYVMISFDIVLYKYFVLDGRRKSGKIPGSILWIA
jgi:hypothetical protein